MPILIRIGWKSTGRKAGFSLRIPSASYTFNAAGSETAEVWQSGYFNDRDRSFYLTFDRHMDALLDAFKAGKQPPVHARAGRRALQLAFAAIESHSSGKRVAVSTDTFEPSVQPEILTPPPNP